MEELPECATYKLYQPWFLGSTNALVDAKLKHVLIFEIWGFWNS